MSKFTFEQYRSIFTRAVDQNKSVPFYASLITAHGAPQFPDQGSGVAVIGVRHDGQHVTDHRENTADDTIVLCRASASGDEVFEFAGTTESGKFTQVENPLGDFKLFPGFYFFQKGVHHGTHACLVQAGPVRGQRAPKHQDFKGDFTITDGSLHIHAGILNLNNVGNWSAGCQVIAEGWNGKPWTTFWANITAAASAGQKVFPYVLVNDSDIAALL
jgi:hypothetical protein